jgi:hypothetical protein
VPVSKSSQSLYVLPAHPVAARLPSLPPPASPSPPGTPLDEPLPLSRARALDDPLPAWAELLLDATDPAELDPAKLLSLDEAAEVEDDAPELTGDPLLADAPELTGDPLPADELWGVVEAELAAVFDAPDEHPGSTVSSHTPARASGPRRRIDERRQKKDSAWNVM